MTKDEILNLFNSGEKNWNDWRLSRTNYIDFSGIDFSNRDFSNYNLSYLVFKKTNFNFSNLSCTNISNSIIIESNFVSCNFRHSALNGSRIESCNLNSSDLSDCNLDCSYLIYSTFNCAILCNSSFLRSVFLENSINDAFLGNSRFGNTSLMRLDMSVTNGLDEIQFTGQCNIDFHTLQKSKFSKTFLFKSGLPQNYINYLPDFIEPEGIRLFPCFLSHSSKDKVFARKLYDALSAKGVLVWFDEKSLKPGDHLETSISKGISMYDKAILICSENSLNSWWVNRELDRVLDKEHFYYKSSIEKKHILIPVKIDQYIHTWENSRKSDIEKYVIGDFINWNETGQFNKAVDLLIEALNVDRIVENPITYL